MIKNLLTFCFLVGFVACALQAQELTIDVPDDMVLIKGGNAQIGNDQGFDNEKPAFEQYISPFLIDKTCVKVREFRLFVQIIGYKTDAEREGYSFLYDENAQEWVKKAGCNWQFPNGPDQPKAQDDDFVVHVSWEDAKAYANFIKKRLPTEFEWEFAASQAQTLGLALMDGTLWQWCENWYESYAGDRYYKKNIQEYKAMRGGFFMDSPALAFRPALRSSGRTFQTFFHTGFRCARSIKF